MDVLNKVKGQITDIWGRIGSKTSKNGSSKSDALTKDKKGNKSSGRDRKKESRGKKGKKGKKEGRGKK